MDTPSSGASLGKWLLRVFLVSLVLAITAPVVLAYALLHLSSDTRALRNAAISGDGATWKKVVEVSVGSLPVGVAKMVLPFTPAPAEARQALSALRSAEVSVHELRGSEVDRARVLRDADASMKKRGWDRTVAVLDGETAVAVYVFPEGGSGGNFKISVLVLDGRQMVAVTGRGNLEPLMDLAMEKAGNEFLAKHKSKSSKLVAADVMRR